MIFKIIALALIGLLTVAELLGIAKSPRTRLGARYLYVLIVPLLAVFIYMIVMIAIPLAAEE
jgi:hypothetical protein